MNKPKVLKEYGKLSEELLALIKLEYPYGFEKKLILFKNKEKKLISALPFETEDSYLLIKMSRSEAQELIQEDDDYDASGQLTEQAKERIEEEFQFDEIEDTTEDQVHE